MTLPYLVSSPGEVYLLNEGGVLNVCCNRAKSFSNSEEDTDDIEVTLIGTSGNLAIMHARNMLVYSPLMAQLFKYS